MDPSEERQVAVAEHATKSAQTVLQHLLHLQTVIAWTEDFASKPRSDRRMIVDASSLRDAKSQLVTETAAIGQAIATVRAEAVRLPLALQRPFDAVCRAFEHAHAQVYAIVHAGLGRSDLFRTLGECEAAVRDWHVQVREWRMIGAVPSNRYEREEVWRNVGKAFVVHVEQNSTANTYRWIADRTGYPDDLVREVLLGELGCAESDDDASYTADTLRSIRARLLVKAPAPAQGVVGSTTNNVVNNHGTITGPVSAAGNITMTVGDLLSQVAQTIDDSTHPAPVKAEAKGAVTKVFEKLTPFLPLLVEGVKRLPL